MITLKIWAACAHDEVATEMVFTKLLKGQLPDSDGFPKLRQILFENPDDDISKWKKKDCLQRFIGKDQILSYNYSEWDEKCERKE